MNTFLALLLGVTLSGFFQKKKDSFIYLLLFYALRFGITNKEKNKVTFCLPNFNMA